MAGSFSENWKAVATYRLTWSDGDYWVGSIALNDGEQFKVVVGPYDGGSVIRYEGGSNRQAYEGLEVVAWQE